MSGNRLKLDMKQNAIHSIRRAIDSLNQHAQSNDAFLMKDAVLFFHHGIELLMKEMLRKHSEYLIFEDIKELHTKVNRAKKEQVDIFFLDSPPKTVSFDMALQRIIAFLDPVELKGDLKDSLAELRRYRNCLEHYAIDVERDDVIKTLRTVNERAISFFEKYVGNIRESNEYKAANWGLIETTYNSYFELEKAVYELMLRFNGQAAPGAIFGTSQAVILPRFSSVHQNVKMKDYLGEIDLLAESDSELWVVEVKAHEKMFLSAIGVASAQRRMMAKKSQKTLRAWVVCPNAASNQSVVENSRSSDILITGKSGWNQLAELLR